jgi:peptidyl-prolyl cis-trans isomerase NIMA-interacting 4
MAPAKNKASAKDSKSKDSKSKDTKTKGKSNTKASTEDEAAKTTKLKPATAINVRHILCAKHSRKEEALAELRAGKKFDEVARDFSEDKARQGGVPSAPQCEADHAGGSLGWKTRGSLLADFETLAYSLEMSSTGSPAWGEVKTSEGYHIVMVEGRR